MLFSKLVATIVLLAVSNAQLDEKSSGADASFGYGGGAEVKSLIQSDHITMSPTCDLQPGRLSKYIIDVHPNTATESECFTLCDDKLKCGRFSFREGKHLCKLYRADSINKPGGFGWIRTPLTCGHPVIDDYNPDASRCDCTPWGEPCTVICAAGMDPDYTPVGGGPAICNNGVWTGLPECVVVCLAASSSLYVPSETGSVEDAVAIRVDEVDIGDKVLSFDHEGNLMFDEVVMVYHDKPWRRSDQISSLYRIEHSNGSISLSAHHLLRLTKQNGETSDHCLTIKSNLACLFMARTAEIGDIMYVREGKELKPKVVTGIARQMDTARAPITLSGNILVDNVAADVCAGGKERCDQMNAILIFMYRIPPLRWLLTTEYFKQFYAGFFKLVYFGLTPEILVKFGSIAPSLFIASFCIFLTFVYFKSYLR